MALIDDTKPRLSLGSDATTAGYSLSSVEIEIIDLFSAVARVLGQPRSVAEIYGFLFVSPEPLALDHFIERLQLSKGSASQGLKYLRDMGAIRAVYVAQDRRCHYEAVPELRKLSSQFLKLQIQPILDEGEDRITRMKRGAKKLSATHKAHLEKRIGTLQTWGRNTRRLMPMILKILGG